jgi:hypothetical protein
MQSLRGETMGVRGDIRGIDESFLDLSGIHPEFRILGFPDF